MEKRMPAAAITFVRKTLMFAAAILSLDANFSYAAPKVSSRAISCPTVIGDKTTGGVKTIKSKNGKFQCYRSESDAKKDGYIASSKLADMNFQGWWRLRFSKVKDTCGNYSANTGLVLFLQIAQRGEAVFGDFCPDLGRLVGAATDHGISTSKTELKTEVNNPLGCANGLVEVTEKLELEKVLEGSTEYSVNISDVRRCPGEDEGMKLCTTIFTGIAFHETHKIWPAVATNTSKLADGCNVALDRCSECHANLSAPPTNR